MEKVEITLEHYNRLREKAETLDNELSKLKKTGHSIIFRTDNIERPNPYIWKSISDYKICFLDNEQTLEIFKQQAQKFKDFDLKIEEVKKIHKENEKLKNEILAHKLLHLGYFELQALKKQLERYGADYLNEFLK